MRDAYQKGRIHNLEAGEVNRFQVGNRPVNTGLTDDQVLYIKGLLSNDVKVSVVSKLTGVRRTLVSEIKMGRIYRNVPFSTTE